MSASTTTTRWSISPSAIARFRTRFDVPTPPLPLVKSRDRVVRGDADCGAIVAAARSRSARAVNVAAARLAPTSCLSLSAWSDMPFSSHRTEETEVSGQRPGP